MSKHTTEENKVEDLLRTLTNSDEITVSNIIMVPKNWTVKNVK